MLYVKKKRERNRQRKGVCIFDTDFSWFVTLTLIFLSHIHKSSFTSHLQHSRPCCIRYISSRQLASLYSTQVLLSAKNIWGRGMRRHTCILLHVLSFDWLLYSLSVSQKTASSKTIIFLVYLFFSSKTLALKMT